MFVMKIFVLTLLKIANTSLEDKKRVNPYSNNNTVIECHQTNKRQRCERVHGDNQTHHEASNNTRDQSTKTKDKNKVVPEHQLFSTLPIHNVKDFNISEYIKEVSNHESNHNFSNNCTNNNKDMLALVKNIENITETHNIAGSNNTMKDTDTNAMSNIEYSEKPNSNVFGVNTNVACVSDITDPFDLITLNFNIGETFIIENIVLTPEIMNTERTQIELFKNFISHASANPKPCEYTPTTPDHCTCRCQWYGPADLKNIAHIMKNSNWLQGFEDFYYDLRHIDNEFIEFDIQYQSHMQNFYDKLKEGHKQEIVNLCDLLKKSNNEKNYELKYYTKTFRAMNNNTFHTSNIYNKKLITKKFRNESQTSKLIISTLDTSKHIMENIFKFLEKHKIQFDTKNLFSAYCSEIKSHYLAFITYTCFEYDALCKCFMFKNNLWGIHAYMAEFYFYIMWKLKRLSITPHCSDDLSKVNYTKHLIKEMQSISDILNQYYIISNEFDDLILEDLCVLVYDFRQNIYEFLQMFYPNDIATTFYHIATKNNYRNAYCNDDTPTRRSITRESMGLQNCSTQAERTQQKKTIRQYRRNILHEKNLALKNRGNAKNMYLLFSFSLASFELSFSKQSLADLCGEDLNITNELFIERIRANSQLRFEIFSVVMKMETYLKKIRKGQVFEHSYDLMIHFNQNNCAIIHVNNTNNSSYELEILTFTRAFYSLSEHILGLMR